MRGRKPKPTATKMLEGNPGKRKLNEAEPVFGGRPPSCPKHLAVAARKEWRRLVKLLGPQGLATAADRGALAAYCQAYARWIEAEEKIGRSGAILKSNGGGFYQNPYLSMANKAIEQMIKIGSEFGLTPASRTRIKVGNLSEESDLERELFGAEIKIGS